MNEMWFEVGSSFQKAVDGLTIGKSMVVLYITVYMGRKRGVQDSVFIGQF